MLKYKVFYYDAQDRMSRFIEFEGKDVIKAYNKAVAYLSKAVPGFRHIGIECLLDEK